MGADSIEYVLQLQSREHEYTQVPLKYYMYNEEVLKMLHLDRNQYAWCRVYTSEDLYKSLALTTSKADFQNIIASLARMSANKTNLFSHNSNIRLTHCLYVGYMFNVHTDILTTGVP